MIKLTKILIISLSIMSTINSFKAPAFCKGLECPEFEVIAVEENIEIREYKTSQWVSKSMKKGSQEELTKKGFWSLFNYISGKNEKKQKINMTAPVLSKINSKTAFTDDEEVFTMSFFLGYNLQKEGTAPIPEEEQVFLHKLESKRYGVISYSGYSNKSVQEENLRKLGNYLAKNEVKFNSNYYFFAGYDSPFTFFNRHNEVWVELI